jgi:hypothetical protein
MGGCGSGRRRQPDAMQATERYHSIDVREWRREGLLEQGQRFRCSWHSEGLEEAAVSVRSFGSYLIISRLTQDDNDSEQAVGEVLVSVTQSACNYGGTRQWFLCPKCSKRVAVLYVTGGFVCRHCVHLRYKSQCEPSYLRTVRRARKIDLRLGGTGVMRLVRGRPKGMHRSTYRQLADEFNELRTKAWAGVAGKLNV